MKTFATTITAALLTGLFAGSALPPALAQIRQHRHETITPTAKKLNERFDADAKHWAGQFESPGRTIFDRRTEIVDLLALKPGMDVADVGAGSGLFSRLIAQGVGPAGTVYAVEVSASLVDHIARTATTMGLHNVSAVLGDPKSPRLPEQSVDVVFIADSYHHFEYPREMLQGIKKALRPNGLFLLIDFNRIEGVSHPFLLEMVRAGKETFTAEIRDAGFELVEEIDMFEDEYVLKFKHR
jgi:ubiquinone/menaquinone biosynthesis C-methylase UbiE